ncbi:MAG: TetR family transcriptional regulator C-terminal domain-containing protein [Gammaproteobacteria bacterium]|nr:TetR family transcriptional regulator C-terminal domain-containing protein [Gammaproteobacteria bacterium]
MHTSVTEKNLHSRSRAVQSEFRIQQLIEATIDCIDKLGLSQTTLARIAERAGVSQGIVVFHFQTKKGLLEQTLRHLSHEYMQCWENACDNAEPDPVSQLCTLIKASFTPSICNRKKISVWYAFCGEKRSRPRYMELCGKNDLAYSSRLLSLCEAIESSSESTLSAQTAALSIEGMIDGLWQNFLIGAPGFKRAQALATVFELLEIIYPDESQNIRQYSVSRG